MKKIVLTIIVGLLSLVGFSQNGRVVDSNGEPLSCATIEVPSQNLTVYADFNGYYNIDVPEGTEIVVSYISYESKKIKSKNEMLVTLDDYSIKIIKE